MTDLNRLRIVCSSGDEIPCSAEKPTVKRRPCRVELVKKI
jgi:hypothetical protein